MSSVGSVAMMMAGCRRAEVWLLAGLIYGSRSGFGALACLLFLFDRSEPLNRRGDVVGDFPGPHDFGRDVPLALARIEVVPTSGEDDHERGVHDPLHARVAFNIHEPRLAVDRHEDRRVVDKLYLRRRGVEAVPQPAADVLRDRAS